MVIFEHILIREGRLGTYFYDSSSNCYSCDLSFLDSLPDGFVFGETYCTVEGKLSRPIKDNLLASFTAKTIVLDK